MPSVTDSLTSLVDSIFHTFTAALGSFLAIAQSLLEAGCSATHGVFATLGDATSGLAHTFEGLTGFLLSM